MEDGHCGEPSRGRVTRAKGEELESRRGSSSGSEGAGVEEGESSGDEKVLAPDELEVKLHPASVSKRALLLTFGRRSNGSGHDHPKPPRMEILAVLFDLEDDLNRKLTSCGYTLFPELPSNSPRIAAGRAREVCPPLRNTNTHLDAPPAHGTSTQRLLNESAEIERDEEKRKERRNMRYEKQARVEKQKGRKRANESVMKDVERVKHLTSEPQFQNSHRSSLTVILAIKP